MDRDCEARPFLINCAGAGLRNRDCVYRFLSLSAVVDWNYSYLRYSYFLINCVGAGLRNRDCVYRFLSLGAVVDWNYSYLRYSYFPINCAGAKLRNQTLRVTDFCFAPYIAQSPLRKTGTRVPSSRMPSISIWLEPIMKSTWTSERLRPAASSSSSVNSAPPSTLVA